MCLAGAADNAESRLAIDIKGMAIIEAYYKNLELIVGPDSKLNLYDRERDVIRQPRELKQCFMRQEMRNRYEHEMMGSRY